MAYKISDRAVLIESNGQSVLITDTLTFGVSGTDSSGDFSNLAGGSVSNSFTLSDNYVFNYFKSPHQGITEGFSVAGAGGTPQKKNRCKFSFSSDGNASSITDLTNQRLRIATASSSTHAYILGGNPGHVNTILRFPFASPGDGETQVGSLSVGRSRGSGHASLTHAYTAGGAPGPLDPIDKFPFSATEGTASDVGDLTEGKTGGGSTSSQTNAYLAGGNIPSSTPSTTEIERFPFASDTNATILSGVITVGRGKMSGATQSETHGYTHGGNASPAPNLPIYNTIDKFPFSNDVNATDVGDLTQAVWDASGCSSNVSGYSMGGTTSAPSHNPGIKNTIEKWSFSTDGNATEVGDLTVSKGQSGGFQV